MNDERLSILSRMFVVLGLVLLIPCALAVQLLRINYVEGEGLRKLWSKQAIDFVPIPAQRGNIYDANGTLLATNSIEYQVAYDPKVSSSSKEDIRKLAEALGKLTTYDSSFYINKIKTAPVRSRYIILAKNLSPTDKAQIDTLNIKGVILEKNYRRNYTFGQLASHTLGFVNHDKDGRIGIEAYYDEELAGKDGVRQVRRDPNNRIFAYVGAPKKLPVEGYSLHTTIDAFIQAILEDELQAGVEKYHANYGTAIIMDPRTGAIKALANYPTFDPNHPGMNADENRRNFAISDMVEPGSTFKLVTAIAAVEQHKVDFEEVFETPKNGEIQIHGLTLRDHDPLGSLTFHEVIQKSSNVATAELAMRMNPNTFYQYARNLGFGTPTNVDIAGEEHGRMAKPYDWSLVSLPWMSHGYELLATPIQVAQAYAAFANKGMLMQPYIVDRIEDENGNIIKQHEPVKIRQVAKKETIELLVPVFESVVSDSGTGEYAQVKGLSIAGKTGTAKKVVNGKYENIYRGSFVGFFPVEDPKYVCFIMLDEPKPSGYGGSTAAPIFKQVATRIAGLDGEIERKIIDNKETETYFAEVPDLKGLPIRQARLLIENMNLRFKADGKNGFVVKQSPEPGTHVNARENILLTLSETNTPTDSTRIKEGYALIPDVTGMNLRSAINQLNILGIDAKIIGSGTIESQFPKAGEWMKKGGHVTIRGKAKSLELLTLAGGNP